MRRVLLVVVSVLAVVISTSGSASAQTKVREDRVGDGPRTADVRTLRVANGADRLVVTVKLRRVVKGRSAVLVGFAKGLEDGDGGPSVLVDVYPVSGGRYAVRALLDTSTATTEERLVRVRCAERDVRVRGGRGGTVRISIDRACVPQLSNRLETAAIAYDKRRLGYSFSELFREVESLRRGDVVVPGDDDVPDIEELIDETSIVTTRRG